MKEEKHNKATKKRPGIFKRKTNDHHCSPRTKLKFSNLFSNYFLTDIVNLEIEERASTPFFLI